MASLEEIIEKIRKNPEKYPETEKMLNNRNFRMDQQERKKRNKIRSIASDQPEEYPMTEDDETIDIPSEVPSIAEITESLVQSGLSRDDAEKLAGHYLGERQPSEDINKKYSDIFDVLSNRYQKLQQSGKIGE